MLINPLGVYITDLNWAQQIPHGRAFTKEQEHPAVVCSPEHLCEVEPQRRGWLGMCWDPKE